MHATVAALKRLSLVGRVVSKPGQMEKTAKVCVTRLMRHPVIEKVVKRRKNYLVHNDSEELYPGDIVRIEECRPISRRKRFTLTDVLHKTERFEDPTTGKISTKYM